MFIPDPIFSIPDPGLTRSRIRIRIKKLSIFNPKNCFEALGNMTLDVHPVYFPIPDSRPGGNKASDPGAGTLRNILYHSSSKLGQAETVKII
jgi:hypothetical protein